MAQKFSGRQHPTRPRSLRRMAPARISGSAASVSQRAQWNFSSPRAIGETRRLVCPWPGANSGPWWFHRMENPVRGSGIDRSTLLPASTLGAGGGYLPGTGGGPGRGSWRVLVQRGGRRTPALAVYPQDGLPGSAGPDQDLIHDRSTRLRQASWCLRPSGS